MTFGHENTLEDIFEFLLEQFTLEEILEMNDLTETDVLLSLFEGGLLGQPAVILYPGDIAED